MVISLLTKVLILLATFKGLTPQETDSEIKISMMKVY